MGPNVINEITVIAHVMIQVLSMPAKVAVVDPISVVGKRPGSRFILFHHEAGGQSTEKLHPLIYRCWC